MTMVDQDFATRLERHRRELHVHCYRMLASFDEAEDVVQETFLRAWRARERFEGDGFRAWLYRIATNACLDHLRRTSRQAKTLQSLGEIPWLQPYPDRLLDEVAADPGAEPGAAVVARETIELTYVAVIQLLPARQRAALILRDVLGFSAAETAAQLDMTVPAANSALQRARATLQERLPREDSAAPALTGEQERALVANLIDAHERADAGAAIAAMREDIRIAMPPLPFWFEGLASFAPGLQERLTDPGEWRLVPTRANRMPATASYLRPWDGTEFSAFKLDVWRFAGDKVAEVTTFGPALFPQFGLPEVLDSA
jgi:RNA polymerase sigma-70 factor (TIGR02960 family)